jgi:hypothetical protein
LQPLEQLPLLQLLQQVRLLGLSCSSAACCELRTQLLLLLLLLLLLYGGCCSAGFVEVCEQQVVCVFIV